MNNEPVAWIKQSEYGKPIIVKNPLHQFSYQAESAKWDDVPLYTHPAKTLTPLTEDECEAIINKHDWFSKSWREMAKEIHDAILRKAQENG